MNPIVEAGAIQVGRVTFGPAIEESAPAKKVIWKSVEQQRLDEHGQPVGVVKFDVAVDALKDASKLAEGFTALRRVRDEKLYLTSCSTFGQWCREQFGEGIGKWLEETL